MRLRVSRLPELMRGTITVILSRLCAVAVVVVAAVFIEQARGSCDNDTQCGKWGETCCRAKCRPFVKCKEEGHCLDDYDCISSNKICVRKRCVKETTDKRNSTGIYVKYCVQDQDCLELDDAPSKTRGFNICCIGQCLDKCLFPTVILRENRSRTHRPCVGRECNTNCTSANSCKESTTTPAPDSSIKKSNADFNNSSGSQRDLSLNPAIIAAIVIAGCIVLTITCICFLREKRLMRKHSAHCRRHRSHNTRNQPFWISRLTRNSTQTSSSAGRRDEEATISFTEPNSSARGLNVECCCDGSQFDAPPSYSTLTIAECPPTYEEAIRTQHDQGIQVNLFV